MRIFKFWIAPILTVLVCGGIALVAYTVSRRPTAPLEVNILGPAVVQVNDLVILEIDKEVDLCMWVIAPKSTQQHALEDGKLLALSFKTPGQYTVVLGVGKGGRVVFAKHIIIVNGDVPVPPDPDPPDPGPEPDNDWAEWAHKTALATVTSPDRTRQANIIANQLRSVAAKIAAGVIRTPKEARIAVRIALNRALGNDAMAWTGFSTKFSEHCITLEKTGGLRTVEQYRIIYLGVARGLDMVKENVTCNTRGQCA